MGFGCALRSQSVRKFCSNSNKSYGSTAIKLPILLLPRRSPLLLSTAFKEFHSFARLQAVKPFLLADIGEGLSVHCKSLGDYLFVNNVEIGIRECEVIQWFVQSGARVEQFDKLCEVQSDKASVEVCGRFT